VIAAIRLSVLASESLKIALAPLAKQLRERHD
jgi:hypothetical protein